MVILVGGEPRRRGDIMTVYVVVGRRKNQTPKVFVFDTKEKAIAFVEKTFADCWHEIFERPIR